MANLVIYNIFTIYLTLYSEVFGDSVFDSLCSRIYFYHEKKTVTPFTNLLNGVYVKTDKIVDNFPVYVHERGNAYFQHSFTIDRFYFSTQGEGFGHYAGLGATVDSNLIRSPSRWMSNVNNKTNIFGNTLLRWEYVFFPQKMKFFTNKIKAKCIPFTDCRSDDIIFTANLTNFMERQVINDFSKHYFYPIPNLFVNFRQVYKHSNYNISSWYLFYDVSGYWYIGSNFTASKGFWAVKDNAFKPEFITNEWNMLYFGVWVPYKIANFQCRGIDIACSDTPCNQGVCLTNMANRSVCTCPFGKTGLTCKEPEKTCDAKFPKESIIVNKVHGSVATLICPKHSTSRFTVLLCKQNNSKMEEWLGDKCKSLPTKRPIETTQRPQRPKRTINLDEDLYYGLQILIKLAVAAIPLALPFVHWWFFSSRSGYGIFRLYSIYCYIGSFIIWIPFIIVYAIEDLRQYGKDFFFHLFIITCIYLAASYTTVLYESLYVRMKKTDVEYVENTYTYINSLIKRKPNISIWLACFHYETDTRPVSHTSSQSYGKTGEKTYEKTVFTWESNEEYLHYTWKDCSDMEKILKLNPLKWTTVKLKLSVIFDDIESETNFLEAKQSLVDANKHRDEHIRSDVKYEVDGFKNRFILHGSLKERPWWMGMAFYILMAFLHLSWPFRLWMESGTENEEITIVKEISIRRNPNVQSTQLWGESKDLPPPYSEKADMI